jgi:large subunit ribosomal protein L13
MIMNNKTAFKKKEAVSHEWYIVDAADMILGRAATRIAHLIRGKHRVDFSPHVDDGAGVVVINCDKIRITGTNKGRQKKYYRYSGYSSGRKGTEYDDMMIKDPTYILRHAVKGMLPKNKIAVKMLRRLKLYKSGQEHKQVAQTPKAIKV